MSAAYKVTYFDITALGEPIRYLLSYGGFDFEDERIVIENWPQLKSKMPLGQMPILEYDGKSAHQHMAICRYLGKECKIAGNNNWEDLEIDSTADTINDFRHKVILYYYEQDPTKREAVKKTVFEETITFYLQRLEQQAKNNDGYLAVGRLTWTDIYFVALLDYITFMLETDVLVDFPNLQALRNTVTALPNIRKWIETRPKKTLLSSHYFLPKH